jgi:hypothetical protein
LQTAVLNHFTTSPRAPGFCHSEPSRRSAGRARKTRVADASSRRDLWIGCPSRIRTSPHGFKVRCPTTRRRGSRVTGVSVRRPGRRTGGPRRRNGAEHGNWCLSAALWTSALSVPAVRLRVRPRPAWRAVPAIDVAQAPLDLGDGIPPPVRTEGRHLRARQRLRDAVRPAGPVRCVRVPARLPAEQPVEAAELDRAHPVEGVGLGVGDGWRDRPRRRRRHAPRWRRRRHAPRRLRRHPARRRRWHARRSLLLRLPHDDRRHLERRARRRQPEGAGRREPKCLGGWRRTWGKGTDWMES